MLSEDRFAIAGRIVAHRGFGKATFVKLRDRSGELQVYVKKDTVGEADYELFRKLERGDFIGARGPAFITRTGELTILCRVLPDPHQVHPPPAREVARPAGRGAALPAALRRSHRQPRGAGGLPQAHRDRPPDPAVPRRTRVPRGRDPHPPEHRRRRGGAALPHPPQRPRSGARHAHRARALSQAARGGRLRTGLRDRPDLPQRGAVPQAQPRVHDARVLPGLRHPRGPDDASPRSCSSSSPTRSGAAASSATRAAAST